MIGYEVHVIGEREPETIRGYEYPQKRNFAESVADQPEGELAQEQPQQKCDTPIKS
jgi:hypothetical protein